MNKNAKQSSIITCHTKEGTFIVYPPSNEKICVKAEKTAKGQMITVGHYDIGEKKWHFAQDMKIPYSVRYVIEQKFA